MRGGRNRKHKLEREMNTERMPRRRVLLRRGYLKHFFVVMFKYIIYLYKCIHQMKLIGNIDSPFSQVYSLNYLSTINVFKKKNRSQKYS